MGICRLGPVALAALILTTGCSLGILRPPPIVLVDANEPVRVRVGERAQRFNAVWRSFFPDEVVIHPGDTVNFQLQFTGEPHTVTLGSLADEAAGATAALGRGATPQQIDALPEVRRLPHLLGRSRSDGSPVLDDDAAQPCFRPAVTATCARTPQPEFTGRQALYSSGWMAEGDVFRVRFARNVKPGTYHVLSLAHPWAPGARIVVRGAREPRPRAYDVKRNGREMMSRVEVTLEPVAKLVTDEERTSVAAGAGSAEAPAGYLTAFAPRDFSVDDGAPVVWHLYGTHSITFNHPKRASDGILERRDGRVRANRLAWRPASSPPLPVQALAVVPAEGAAPTSIDAGRWSGDGFLSSGVIDSYPPSLVTYSLTFTKPGAYSYRCLVHERMRGTIRVR
jgi:plastocyanin